MSAPNGHRRKGDVRGRDGDDRRGREQQDVRGLRAEIFLEDQFDDVGQRLQQALGPDQERPPALLHERRNLALRVDHHRGADLQRKEDRDEIAV